MTSILDIHTPAWQRQASCNGLEEFFDHGYPTKGKRGMCAECPVQQQCLEWSLEMEAGQDHLFRACFTGGMTPQERAAYSKGLEKCLERGCDADNDHYGLCWSHHCRKVSDFRHQAPRRSAEERGEAA